MRLLLLIAFSFVVPSQVVGQSTSQAASDSQAVAIVQAAITAMGGTKAIGLVQSWTFQAQAEGRISNGVISEALTMSAPQNGTLPIGTAATAPPPWARPRSLFVPALVSSILVQQSQDVSFSLKQAAPSRLAPNSPAVVFSVMTKTGVSVPAQKWYFDSVSGLPARIEFIAPAKIGVIESYSSVVTLSNYQAVAGVLYPFQIVTFLRRASASEIITLHSVLPGTPVGSTISAGGAL